VIQCQPYLNLLNPSPEGIVVWANFDEFRVIEGSDGSLGAAESAGPYHTKLRILFSYFLIKKCLRYFSSNPNNNLNYNFHFCLVPNYIVLCTVCFVNTHISTYKYLNASRIVLIKKKCV
jgi:hypothetical protein